MPFQNNGNRQTSESDTQKVSIVFPLSFIFTSMLAMLMLIIFKLIDVINVQILKQFLRGCKFSLERSKEKLDNFHLVKGALPEWFDRSAK